MNIKIDDPTQVIHCNDKEYPPIPDGILDASPEREPPIFDFKKVSSIAKGYKNNFTGTNPPTIPTISTKTSNSPTEAITRELLKPVTDDYPANFLPPSIGVMCVELAEASKVGTAIPAHCALAYLSLASQRLFNVRHPLSGNTFPTSVNFLTVAKSGERKSGIENVLRESMNRYEESNKELYSEQLAEYQAKKDIHDSDVASLKSGKKPKDSEEPKESEKSPEKKSLSREERENKLKELYLNTPVKPIPNEMVVRLDATQEGLFRCLAERLSVGMFGDEGLEFFSSHGMKKDGGAQGRSLSQFSYLWDGSRLDRVRATGHESLKNVRVTLHVMIQPKVLEGFDQVLELMNDQGFGARVCIDHAYSKLGKGQNLTPRENDAFLALTNKYCSNLDSVKKFNQVILRILNEPITRHKKPDDGLEFKVIELTDLQARKVWGDFLKRVNDENGEGGKYHPISGIAAKSPEIALRLAAQFAIFDAAAKLLKSEGLFYKPEVGDLIPKISEENMRYGVGLAEYYLNRRTTKFQEDAHDPVRKDAKELVMWMLKKGKTLLEVGNFSSLPYKFQKNTARTRKAIELAINERAMEPNTGDLNYRGEPRSWFLTEGSQEWLSQIEKGA